MLACFMCIDHRLTVAWAVEMSSQLHNGQLRGLGYTGLDLPDRDTVSVAKHVRVSPRFTKALYPPSQVRYDLF
jgi:hypothetical protein